MGTGRDTRASEGPTNGSGKDSPAAGGGVMGIDLATIARRLKAARTNCGVSQERAAEIIGVPRTAVVHIEAGNRSISTIELVELAKLYKRPVAEFLTDEDFSNDEDVLVALHRLTGDGLSTEELECEVRRCVSLCREGYDLEQLLDRRPRHGPPAYDVPDPKTFAAAIEQGEDVAEQERMRLGLAYSPIPDMADLLSCEGIWASGAKLPKEMSGLFLHQSNIGFVILVNYDHPRSRKRFSYAHEYAHALIDRKRSVNITSKQNANELIEKRANAFAAAFLLPKTGAELFLANLNKGGSSRRNFQVYNVATDEGMETERRSLASEQEVSFRDAALLAAHYGVSYQVAVYRLRDLDFVTREHMKALLEKEPRADAYLDFLGRPDVVATPRESDRELISQLVPLAVEAYSREEISKGKLLEIAKLLGVEARKLTALA